MNQFQKITLTTLDDNQIWLIKFMELSRESMDEWGTAVRAYRTTRSDSSRYLIYDGLQIQWAGITPFMRAKITELAKEDTRATGRVAIITDMPKSVLYFFEAFVNLTARHTQPNLAVRLFKTVNDALLWIKEDLDSSTG